MVNLEWSEWTKDECPSMTCNYDGFTAIVQIVDTCKDNGYNNRQWTVKNQDGATVGSGYVLTTVNATMMVEIVLYVNGVLDIANKLMQMALKRHPVR